MSNALLNLKSEYDYANGRRNVVLSALRAEIAAAESEFAEKMKAASAQAHTAGVTRYMAQKVTGAPASQVNEWFGDLPTSSPGRRRKDDPVYA